MVHTKNRFISILLILPSHHVAFRGFQLLLACSFFFFSKLMLIVPAWWKHHYLQEVSPLCERERIEDRAELFVPLCVLVHGFEITFYVNVLMSHGKWMMVRSTLWTFTRSRWLIQSEMSYSLPCAVAQTLKSFYPLPTTLSWVPAVDVQKTWKISTYLFPATCSAPFFHPIFQNEAQLILYSLESVLKRCLKKPNKTSLITLIKTLVHLHIQNYPLTQCMIF